MSSTHHVLLWDNADTQPKYVFTLNSASESALAMDTHDGVKMIAAEIPDGFTVELKNSELHIFAPSSVRVRGNAKVLSGAAHTAVHAAIDNAFGPTVLVIANEKSASRYSSSMSGQTSTPA